MAAPDRSEAAEYYFRYIDQVPHGDIRQILQAQLSEVLAVTSTIPDERSRFRYGPDKWSIREVVGHLSDCERMFTFRAFWFARAFDSPLPDFDQHIAMSASGSHERSWSTLVEEFRAVRQATLMLFLHLPDDAWMRRGIASGNPFTVRALAYLAAGHVEHHLKILRGRYLTT